jgi:hypothetical protein
MHNIYIYFFTETFILSSYELPKRLRELLLKISINHLKNDNRVHYIMNHLQAQSEC